MLSQLLLQVSRIDNRPPKSAMFSVCLYWKSWMSVQNCYLPWWHRTVSNSIAFTEIPGTQLRICPNAFLILVNHSYHWITGYPLAEEWKICFCSHSHIHLVLSFFEDKLIELGVPFLVSFALAINDLLITISAQACTGARWLTGALLQCRCSVSSDVSDQELPKSMRGHATLRLALLIIVTWILLPSY